MSQVLYSLSQEEMLYKTRHYQYGAGMKNNTGNTKKVVTVHFSGEQGIDSRAMAKKFFYHHSY